MHSFHEYLVNKNELLEENMLQRGAMGVMAGLSAAGAANAEKFNLSGEADSFKPQMNLHMPATAIALKSFIKHGDYENGMKGNKAIKSITIDVMQTEERHGNSFIVSISAQVEAPDKATAKRILVSELMKVAAQKGIQKEMIGLLKSLQKQMNENSDAVFDLELEIGPNGAQWV